MAFDPQVLVPGGQIIRFVPNFKSRLEDGYQFGDFTKAWYGFNNEPTKNQLAQQQAEQEADKRMDSIINNYSDNIEQLGQQSSSASDAANMLKELAKEDPSYRELYVQMLAERENQERAYKWYEDFSNTYYQRSVEDLEKAGLNPWLALQSLGSAGTGAISVAGTFSGSTGSSAYEKYKEAKLSAETQEKTRRLLAYAAIVGAIIKFLV